MSANTAIGAAFARAGVISPTERLQAVATSVLSMSVQEWTSANRTNWDDPSQRTRMLETAMQAMKTNPRNWEGARDALYKAIRNDAELLWTLFEPYRSLATQRLLTDAASLLRVQDGRTLEMKLSNARETRMRDDARPQVGRRSEPASAPPSPTTSAPAASNLKELADKHEARGKARVEMVIRLSRLDTVMVNDKKIGDCTVAEIREWAKRRQSDMRNAGRDARFALALVANLPSGAVIREWWKRPEEVDALYAKAEAEYAA